MNNATLVLMLSLILVGCATPIAEVKSEEMIGEKVTVSGVVENSIKIGDFSGYTITDDSGDSIGVVSDSLPAEGEKQRVTGVVQRTLIFGYYIDAE